MSTQRIGVCNAKVLACRVGDRRVDRFQIRVQRDLRVDGDASNTWKLHNHVRTQPPFFAFNTLLLGEMHARGQARHLNNRAQRDFAPLPALTIVAHRARQQLRRV